FMHVTAAALTLLLMWSIPSGPVLWAKLHGASPENTISTENGSGLSVLKHDNPDPASTTLVFVNGLGQSWIPYSRLNAVHSQLAVLPVMLHPAPREVAIIGLGSGDTVHALGGREEVTAITCIEIIEPQLESLRLLHQKRPYAALGSVLHDTRIRFVFADGRI